MPPPDFSPAPSPEPSGLAEFFQLDWVNAKGSRAEILFIHRRKGDGGPESTRFSKEAHVAFPGGRMEEGDEGGHYTGMSFLSLLLPRLYLSPRFVAMRQVWEEIGLDLAEKDFICAGQLDDREITTSLGKRLLMILSPFGISLPLPFPSVRIWYP